MKAIYKCKIDVEIIHNINDLKELTEIKSHSEMATDIITLICDEVAQCGGVAVCEVIESELNVK